MTREEIIKLVREIADPEIQDPIGGDDEHALLQMHELKRLVARVAAAEREACAKLCEEQMQSYMSKRYTTDPLGGFRERFAAKQCATAIRARSET